VFVVAANMAAGSRVAVTGSGCRVAADNVADVGEDPHASAQAALTRPAAVTAPAASRPRREITRSNTARIVREVPARGRSHAIPAGSAGTCRSSRIHLPRDRPATTATSRKLLRPYFPATDAQPVTASGLRGAGPV